MKRREFLQQGSAADSVALSTPSGVVKFSQPVPGADSLVDRFRNPPHSARLQMRWHWMNGPVTLHCAQFNALNDEKK